MPYMRTFYRQTGGLVSETAVQGYLYGSFNGGAGVSMRTPGIIAIASAQPAGGSYAQSALGILSMFYGSGIFGSGYVFIPIAVAGGSVQSPLAGFAPLLSVASQAVSLGGASGQIGYGVYNSASIVRFNFFAQSGASAATYPTSNVDIVVTYLLVSAPPFLDQIS